ncbi:hypothetical protein BG011_008159 [Mortierella polycephala]|uniref:Nudix hydrolase domain-containing protein n=1 Tax=Mortierella polycephala TaxID=41804 RepID=A0A9P6PRR9_9FUNG|nr:hypothetical protein BG011_008159 [Mortierella polycephala]
MSAFILPTSCRCPQRSMLSHFVTPPIATSSLASRATRTRIITTTATNRTRASPASSLQHQGVVAESLFASEPFLLNATTYNSESEIFAPQYQQHAPIQSKYQSPFTTPSAPKKQASYFQQDHYQQSQQQQQVYPSHLQRMKRQPSLKHASYASRTIPPMMAPAPRTCSNIDRSALGSHHGSCSDFQFDRAFLDLAKRRLDQNKQVESHHFDYCGDKPLREAAVFIPLCVVKGIPSVLFTVRSTKLRNHRGECSFPGGKRDSSDENCLATALREMEEEIFISPKDVELLGEYSPMPNKDCTMRVQPYVGFIRTPIDDVASIRYNPDEVQKVFSIPITDLLDPEKRKQLVRFRDSKYMTTHKIQENHERLISNNTDQYTSGTGFLQAADNTASISDSKTTPTTFDYHSSARTMSPRPARSTAKKASVKIKNEVAERLNEKRRSKGNGGNYQGDNDDDNDDDVYMEESSERNADDSDEYVGPKEGDGGPGDFDEDELEVSAKEELDDDAPISKTKKKRKKMQAFAVSLDEMNKLLTTHDNGPGESGRGRASTSTSAPASSTTDSVSVANANMEREESFKMTPTKLPAGMSTIQSPKKVVRHVSKKSIHKRGDMNCSDKIPGIWRLSYQAPTSEDVHHVSMQESFLRKTVYPNIRSRVKDFQVVTNQLVLDEYMPEPATTKIRARDTEYEMRTMTAQYMKTTEKAGVNDGYIFNTGLSVWAMDWCPLASYEEEPSKDMNYIAVGGFPDTAENCIARDQLYPLGKQDAHPNVIQIWKMNCSTNDEGELQGESEAYLAMCILHPYGAVFDLKWCPTGNVLEADPDQGDLTRLGILAATFSDGSIQIFSVPEPASLRDSLGIETAEGSSPKTSSTMSIVQYPEPYATIRLGDVCFMSINWGTSERLVAGATNGTVPVWDMKSMLTQTKETLAEKDSEFLDPVYMPQVHDVSVRSVDFLRDDDAAIVPWIMVSSGYDGKVRYTDLHDLYSQIDIKSILGVPMSTICIPWAEANVYIDVDFGAKMDQLYLESRGFRLFNTKGTIWDFSYSDYQPFVAAASSDGRVKISNPAYKAKRGYGMVQNHIYQIQEVTGEGGTNLSNTTITIDDSQGTSQIQEDPKAERVQLFMYLEGEEKEYINKSAGYLGFYRANIAIQTTQWSRCYHSAAWLASGSAGGLVRIDNTMLRKDEGGAGNKIKYAPEPYLMKKRLASGRQYNELGQQIGPDGLPISTKIGRPKKVRDPTEEAVKAAGKGKRGGNKRGPGTKSKAGAKSTTAKTGRGGKSKAKASGDSDGDEGGVRLEDEEAEEIGLDEEEGADDVVEGGDDDEFVARSKRAAVVTSAASSEPSGEKRTTRLQTGKLAPIFMRNYSQAELDEDNEDDNHGQEDEQEQELSSRMEKSSKKPQTSAPAKACPPSNDPTAPRKPRGRPRKNPLPAEAIDKAAPSSQSALSMASITRRLSEAAVSAIAAATKASAFEIEAESASMDVDFDVHIVERTTTREEDSVASMNVDIAAVDPKGKQKASPTAILGGKKAGRPPKGTNNAVAGALKSKDSQPVADKEMNAAGVEAQEEAEDIRTSSASSSRASSVAPSSPRKPRGPYSKTKKKAEELKKQSHSLKDFWGAAASVSKASHEGESRSKE